MMKLVHNASGYAEATRSPAAFLRPVGGDRTPAVNPLLLGPRLGLS